MANKKKEMKRKELMKVIESFTLFDNDFMRAALKHKLALELVLSILLNRIIRIKKFHTEHEMFSLHGKSVVFDAYIETMDGLFIDFEVQDKNSGAVPKRAAYNASILNDNVNPPGTEYNDMKKTLVIFVTKKDYFKKGEPMYHIPRIVKETGKEFNDGSGIIYVNGTYRGDDEVGRLMHDFACADYNDMYYTVLKDQVRKFKEGTGVDSMCQKMEDYGKEVARRAAKKASKEGERKGERKGELRGKLELIKNLMSLNNFTAETAMKMLGIPPKQQSLYLKYLV